MSIRDNLLVTIGSRAAYMDTAGHIELPSGSRGEDELAMFASGLTDRWLKEDPELLDVSFDEYIETALEKRFPKQH